jgi:hypothetical protein
MYNVGELSILNIPSELWGILLSFQLLGVTSTEDRKMIKPETSQFHVLN